VARPAKAPARSAPAEQNAHGTKPRSDAAAAAHGAEDATHDTPLQVLKSDVAKSLPMEDSESVPDADTVLKWLRDGNQRWVAGKPMDPNIEPSRRARLAAVGQKPLATIVTCADSRVPADRLFDRGVGELFVIRVAGNIAGDSETGTVEYGVGHLKTPVLIVMGHSKCGAVAAAASGAQLHGKVAQLVSSIVPSVERAKRNNPDLAGDDLVAAAVRENVWQTIYDLFKKSPELAEMARTNQVRVIGAVCDISSGEVEFLGNHPWQAELIDALAAGRAADAENATHATVPDHK
jgi:carbonic anhydrase